MKLTPYHARYYSALLQQRLPAHKLERYLPALQSARIDLHPHQVDAALFANASQFQNGVILADEESLGKTIEAGIVLLQAAIEGKSNLLVLCQGNKLRHWQDELWEKFSLNHIPMADLPHQSGVVVLSYSQAQRQLEALSAIKWDICVLDDAHLLANASLGEKKAADAIRSALGHSFKLLLTHAPMQNSLLDLYYLLRFIDDANLGGTPESFRQRYAASNQLKQQLIERAQLICQRTLRRQALTMPISQRQVRTVVVSPSPQELALSQGLSEYFHRDNLIAFPDIEEHRIRLIYWKLLSSSPQALHASILKLMERLPNTAQGNDEKQQLQTIAHMAQAICTPTRGALLLRELHTAWERLKQAGAPLKALLFSENRQTLQYLDELLRQHGYLTHVHLAGQNARKAQDALRQQTQILLTTDSAIAGADFSFCALVINYDLPWNVQKLEERISRCHRYGQKHDVLVINFIDPSNRADRRLYQLLNRKLKQFDQLFGASETVLGELVDNEDYCLRSKEDVQRELAFLESLNQEVIRHKVKKAEADLLAHFDEQVRTRFAQYGVNVVQSINRMERMLWEIICHKLQNLATIMADKRQVMLNKSPYKGLTLTRNIFALDKNAPPGERLHLNHPLVKRILQDCLQGELSAGYITLQAGGKFVGGMQGELGLWQLHMLSGAGYQNALILSGFTKDIANNDHMLYDEDWADLLRLPVESCTGGVLADNDIYKSKQDDKCGAQLARIRDEALRQQQKRMVLEQDALLQKRLKQLEQWAEDERAALSLWQEEMLSRIKQLKNSLSSVSGFSERFQLTRRSQTWSASVASRRKNCFIYKPK